MKKFFVFNIIILLLIVGAIVVPMVFYFENNSINNSEFETRQERTWPKSESIVQVKSINSETNNYGSTNYFNDLEKIWKIKEPEDGEICDDSHSNQEQEKCDYWDAYGRELPDYELTYTLSINGGEDTIDLDLNDDRYFTSIVYMCDIGNKRWKPESCITYEMSNELYWYFGEYTKEKNQEVVTTIYQPTLVDNDPFDSISIVEEKYIKIPANTEITTNLEFTATIQLAFDSMRATGDKAFKNYIESPGGVISNGLYQYQDETGYRYWSLQERMVYSGIHIVIWEVSEKSFEEIYFDNPSDDLIIAERTQTQHNEHWLVEWELPYIHSLTSIGLDNPSTTTWWGWLLFSLGILIVVSLFSWWGYKIWRWKHPSKNLTKNDDGIETIGKRLNALKQWWNDRFQRSDPVQEKSYKEMEKENKSNKK